MEKGRAPMRRLRRATAAGEERAEMTEARLLRENRPQRGRLIRLNLSSLISAWPTVILGPLPGNKSIPQSDGGGDYQGC